MALLSVFSVLFAVTQSIEVIFGGDGMELIQTPHGFRPSKCIIRHEENVEITELKDGSGVYAYYPGSQLTKFFEADPDCIEDWHALSDTNTSNLKAWEDYAYFTTPEEMGNFTSTYVIPNESPKGGSQLLYYFIGFQNNDDPGVTIVQPVVNYDLSGQYVKGWSMEPWNCCPAGQSHTGKNVVMAPGDSALAWVYAEGAGNDVVIGMSKADGSDPTVLTVKDNNRRFDWACATLEDYSATCAETNKDPFACNNNVLTSLKGTNVSPDWKTTGQAICNGGAVVTNSGADVAIYGQDCPSRNN
eukprot:CAMPEP_0201575986 /NCGR_PEP_ID=MMETSP0190_2-20130828/21500_1 /ASSEMBLY_ACC=CAM_ASM_000263 /TAXON_ID=37353 /ORGANISM="Rosalina sp." /LENGTH=300 /DNA_ID=CAMNT_0048006299 /DNA_START=57 /DNA_END=959 /DNA_ORIENTATION=-